MQFGISGSSALNDKYLHHSIKDDPVKTTNAKGTIVYADAGPNTRSTQLFVNYADNGRLDAMGFAPFGRVVAGMDVALKAFNPTPGVSGGVDQNAYESKGNAWVKKKYPGIDFIESAVVDTTPVDAPKCSAAGGFCGLNPSGQRVECCKGSACYETLHICE